MTNSAGTNGMGSGPTGQTTAPNHKATAPRDERSMMPAWAPKLVVFAAIMAVGVFASLSLLARLRGFIWILILSLFLSLAVEPGVNWFVRHRWTRFWATSFIVTLAILLVIGLVVVFVPMFVAQFALLGAFAAGILDRLNPYLNEWFGTELSFDTIKQIGPTLAGLGLNAIGGLLGVVGSVVGFIASFLAIAFFAFFFVLDGPKLRRYICSFLKPEQQKTVLWTWDAAVQKTGGYLYSRILQASIAGVGSFIVMTILGIPFALPLAVWAGLVSQFIPVIGSYLAAILPLLVAIFISPTSFLILGGYFFLYQGVENYYLGPKLYGKTMELHPAVALGSAFMGGALFGVAGAFLALPAAAVIQAGITAHSTRYEVMDSELTRDQPPEPEQTKDGAKSRRWGRAKGAKVTNPPEAPEEEGGPPQAG